MKGMGSNVKPVSSEAAAGPVAARPKPGKGKGMVLSAYTRKRFLEDCEGFLYPLRQCRTLEAARQTLRQGAMRLRVENSMYDDEPWSREVARTRDATRALLSMISSRSEHLTGFSVTRALWDLARGEPREDLEKGFFAEMMHIVWALEHRTADQPLYEEGSVASDLTGREAARVRSEELDQLWTRVENWMQRYDHGLQPEAHERRAERRKEVLEALGGTDEDWRNWHWQVRHVGRNLETLHELVQLSEKEKSNISRACENHLPFGVTPFYLSLMDGEEDERDRAVRSQVFPPRRYVDEMIARRADRSEAFDFMGEMDTSPVDLVTRRYPGIVILKPFNTCPQICVYCQRNWEIDEVLDPHAMASWDDIETAVQWIAERPAIHDVLVTGGDPMLLEDHQLERLLEMLTAIPSVRRIRIGTRTPVTLPMRFTDELVEMLARFRKPVNREIAVVTHVQYPYEINAEMAAAVEKLRLHGLSVYNQQVYTFYVSRRFETALLRRLLRRIGIDPYYTFLPKGKAETDDYRVPLARLVQEEAEEARLMPGLTRTDEAIYNVPRLGKNYLRASQHRDLLTILPDGTRLYEFHPWEKNIVDQRSYLGESIPIFGYLTRLEEEFQETVGDYESIWYYF
ncbi:MAG: KamA family radical SAM protein [Polyangia bacterium]